MNKDSALIDEVFMNPNLVSLRQVLNESLKLYKPKYS